MGTQLPRNRDSGGKALPDPIPRYNLAMGPDSELGATGSPSTRGAERFSRGKLGAVLLVLFCGAACASPPTIRAGDSRIGHDFVLTEEYRGQVRKIAFSFEPGRVLQWELTRSDDPERNKIPFRDLDYGEAPVSMDQIFPPGIPERPEVGQRVTIVLEYGTEGDRDPVVPKIVTRWYQKKSRYFSELSEQEAEAGEHPRKTPNGEKP